MLLDADFTHKQINCVYTIKSHRFTCAGDEMRNQGF